MTVHKNDRLRWPGWLAGFALCGAIALAGVARAQEVAPAGTRTDDVSAAPDSGTTAPASPAQTADDATAAPAAVRMPSETGTALPPGRDVSERLLFPNILHDQKDLWLFPVQLAHGHHWLPTVAVVGVTAGLIALDAHDTPYFRRTTTFEGFNRVFSGDITISAILAAPVSFYAVGLFDKDPYARKTGLFAGEAVADVTVLEEVMKVTTMRLRPGDIPPYGNFSDTFFAQKHWPLSTSFPSGHAITAFAVATVITERYGKQHRWVPWMAYGVAGVIGFSRVTLQAHFPSDVFMGAALGYAVARFDVLREP